MSQTVDELLDALDQAIAFMKGRGEGRFQNEIGNLARVKKVLERLDPDEIDALLEGDDDGEE
jgi:hypothetical protein